MVTYFILVTPPLHIEVPSLTMLKGGTFFVGEI